MLIEAMPDVLTWKAPADDLVRVFGSYVDLLADSLARLLRRLQRAHPDAAQVLWERFAEASEVAFLRVLTAPETSFRLLWDGDESDLARAEFLLGALQAELAREGRDVRLAGETWTAVGDVGFKSDGSLLGNWNVPTLGPLDFGSPLVGSVATGEIDGADGHWEPFADDEIAAVRRRFKAASLGIEATRPVLREFVVWFNRVVVCLKDPMSPTSSSSGSTGQYVGRTFITNPHLPGVDDVFLAEGLVHEGIHGLLYMQERQRAWVTDELYMGSVSVVSPWSGNPLQLRPYLQACFVWYGLLHFWCLALEAGSFPAGRTRERIGQAVTGFLRGSLTAPLQPYLEEISPDLLAAVEVMQDLVMRSFAEVAPDKLRAIGNALVDSG
jgi:hypothetical protein